MNYLKLMACLAALGLGLSLAKADDDQPDALLPNGGFEKWADWTPPVDPAIPRPTVVGGRAPRDWTYEVEAYERKNNPTFPITVTIYREEDQKHGGDYSVKIQNAAMTDIGGLTLVTPLIVTPNTTYKIKFWYKGQDIVPNAGDGAGVIFWTAEGPLAEMWKSETIAAHAPDVKTGTFDWTPYEMTITTKPDSKHLAITAQLRRAQGMVWFDDFEMTQTAPATPTATTTNAP